MFLQTVATNTIINLDDWRLMYMIMKPIFNILLHGNNFLQISSFTRYTNRNRTINLLKRTELSGRNFVMIYRQMQYIDNYIDVEAAVDDHSGILSVPISRGIVVKNILSDDNVDIMSMRRFTFFDEWYNKCETMHPQHQHRFFANEQDEVEDMRRRSISNYSCNPMSQV